MLYEFFDGSIEISKMAQESKKEVLLQFFKSAVEADLVSGILKAEGVANIVRRQGMEVRIGYPDYDGAAIFVLEGSLENAKKILESYIKQA